MKKVHKWNRVVATFAVAILSQGAHARLNNVLHYYKTGYTEYPGGIQGCTAALDSLAALFKFTVKHTRESADLINVQNFDLVIYDNNTDAGGLAFDSPGAGEIALMTYMNHGGRFLGFSFADDHRGMWDWYDTALFSGIRISNHPDDSAMVYRAPAPVAPGYGLESEVANMWNYMRDSLRIATDSIGISGRIMHFSSDALGKPGVTVLQELRGSIATGGIRQSYAWAKELNGGGRMIYTALGYEAYDWKINHSWLKKATYAYMKLLTGEFLSDLGVKPPEIRVRGSRLEVSPDPIGSVHVTDIRGKDVASGMSSTVDGIHLGPGVYFVTFRQAGKTISKTIVLP